MKVCFILIHELPFAMYTLPLVFRVVKRNGLRDFQTFMINILTVYGNIIVYFKLPDWVQDWGDSLVEKEEDPMSVKALKVRLAGKVFASL